MTLCLSFSARSRRSTLIVALGSIALLTSGCAAGAVGTDQTPSSPIASQDTAPLTLDNCGFETTIDASPERILAIKSSPLELLLALGAGDRVIGSAYPDGPLPEEFAAAAGHIALVSDKVPSQEAALALEPDFIFAGWESNFSVEGVGERQSLEQLGVTTYVAPAACKAPGYMPDPLTFDTVFDGFLEIGRIIDEDEAATALVAAQKAQLDGLAPDERGLSALWYSSGTDQPYVGAGIGAPEMIMSSAGLENIFADVADTWTSTSWELIADRNPAVIVLVDAAWNTAASKIDLLKSNPATSTLDAVAQDRFIVIDFAATEAGIRNVDAVAALIEQLGEL